MPLYRGIEITVIPVNYRFKPIISNWRGFEVLKTTQTFKSTNDAIQHAKELIDNYYTFQSLHS